MPHRKLLYFEFQSLLLLGPCAQICVQVFVRQKNNTSSGMILSFSAVSVTTTHIVCGCQKHQTSGSMYFKKLNWEKKNCTTGHKFVPQASNFYTSFLANNGFFGNSFALLCNASQPTVLRLFVMQ